MIITPNSQQDLGGKMREEMLRSRARNQKEAEVMGKPSTLRDLHCTILADVPGHVKRRRSLTQARREGRTQSQIKQPK